MNLLVNYVCLSACFFVCLYRNNIKIAKPIGPKLFVATQLTIGKVHGWSKFDDFVQKKFLAFFFENAPILIEKSAKKRVLQLWRKTGYLKSNSKTLKLLLQKEILLLQCLSSANPT